MPLPEPSPAGPVPGSYEWDLAQADQCLQQGSPGEALRILLGMESKLLPLVWEARRDEVPKERLQSQLHQVEEVLHRCQGLRDAVLEELRAVRAQQRFHEEIDRATGGPWLSKRA